MPYATPGPSAFRVRCTWQPNGDHGLEGFDLGHEYFAEQATDAKGLHYRVWPDWHQHGGTPPNYYEACTPRAFARCFERI